MFMNVREVCRQMNSHALQGKEFLFAFDFELKEGIFIANPLEQKDNNGVYRKDGYMIITYAHRFAELEKNEELLIIEY